PLTELDDELGQPLKTVNRAFDSLAAGLELRLRLFGQKPCFVGRIANAGLVAHQPRGDFLELIEDLHMLADALSNAFHVAGAVAAFHRQRTAIARDCADRIFRDLLDSVRGHRSPSSHSKTWGAG